MQIKAIQKYVRTSSRKIRLVANQIKSLTVPAALQQLTVVERDAATVVAKVLRQAIANAMHNHGIAPAQLQIESIQVNGGPTYKRFRAVSRGRAHSIMKRTSHVMIVLKTAEVAAPVQTAVAPQTKTEVKAEAQNEAAVTEQTTAQTKVKAEKKAAAKKPAAKKSTKKASTEKSK